MTAAPLAPRGARITTTVALLGSLSLAALGTYSALAIWIIPHERLATGLLGLVGLLLAGLVAFDLRRPPPGRAWHWKPAALSTAASALLLAGVLVTEPITVVYDPQISRLKVQGRVVGEGDDTHYRARVWPDDLDVPVFIEPWRPDCRHPPVFARVGDILRDHHGVWDPPLACPAPSPPNLAPAPASAP